MRSGRWVRSRVWSLETGTAGLQHQHAMLISGRWGRCMVGKVGGQRPGSLEVEKDQSRIQAKCKPPPVIGRVASEPQVDRGQFRANAAATSALLDGNRGALAGPDGSRDGGLCPFGPEMTTRQEIFRSEFHHPSEGQINRRTVACCGRL